MVDMGLRMSLALESSSDSGTQWTKRDSGYFRVTGTLDKHALEMILYRNSQGAATQESMVLYVDMTNSSLIPPPISALIGMANLLQRAYPDRFHRIYFGPVNSLLRRSYGIISPMLRPRSRDKIVMLGCPPSSNAVAMTEKEWKL